MASDRERADYLQLIRQGQPGLVLSDNPLHPEYAGPRERLASYKNWPSDHIVHRRDLSRHGFYHTGVGDTVRCFLCEIELHSWQEGDDPYTEHCERYAACPNIQLFKPPRTASGTEETERPFSDARAETEGALDSDVSMDLLSQRPDQLARPSHADTPEGLASENERLRQLKLCKVCRENDSNVLFLPCSHLVSCDQCTYTCRQCPVCNTDIRSRVKIFRS